MRHHRHHHDWEEHWERHWRQHAPPGVRGRLPKWMWMRFRIHAHLQRRLFFWNILTIVITAGAMWLLSTFFGPESGWRAEEHRARTFVSGQFAQVWNDPPRRDALAASLARDLDLDLVLETPENQRLAVFGSDACRRPWTLNGIQKDGAQLGAVKICFDRHTQFDPWRVFVAIFVVVFILGVMSGRIARRLARPLSELARVVEELGEGRLKSRYELGWNTPGEIAVLGASFNRMAERIERQLADQRELLAGVSHELRTPLARIRLLIELVRGADGDSKRLGEIEREVVEIDGLVGELLASARLDFAALVKRPLDARELVARALERVGVDQALGHIETRDTAFEGDVTLLQRALSNLAENAKRHAGGLIALRVTREGDDLVFCAEDAGPGFPADGEGQVFVPFAPKANGEPREAGSLGLGLALVKRIAEAHGGRAFAENREGGGARVGIRIPGNAPGTAARA